MIGTELLILRKYKRKGDEKHCYYIRAAKFYSIKIGAGVGHVN